MGKNGASAGMCCGYLWLFAVIFGEKGANIGQNFLPLPAQTHKHMANIRIVLDKRRARRDNSYPIIFTLHHRETIRLSTGMYAALSEWNEPAGAFLGKTTTQKAHNARLRHLLGLAETLIMNMEVAGELRRTTAAGLKQRLKTELGMASSSSALLVDYLEKAKLGKAPRTQRLFAWTQKQVQHFDSGVGVADVDEAWMLRYRDDLLQRYSPNTVAQAMAWVSRALSLAVADGVISRNPVKGVRKPREVTRKKSLTLEKLRELRDMELPDNLARARDIFLLQFYLLGINVVDLYDLRQISDGRIEYRRHKTGTLYSVKVEPEALEIIERYAGGEDRLVRLNGCGQAATACSVLTRALKCVMPDLSTNWARHTWATIAAELEIPIETISHALGHQIGSPVTAIYIAFNQKKVDEANRRVIDYVNADLKGKK